MSTKDCLERLKGREYIERMINIQSSLERRDLGVLNSYNISIITDNIIMKL